MLAVNTLDLRFDSTGLQRRRRGVRDLFVGSTESPAPPLKLDEGLQIVLFSKIRPKSRGHVELAIGNLPKIKVADPQLATRPN
jgi:hypothetical protein